MGQQLAGAADRHGGVVNQVLRFSTESNIFLADLLTDDGKQ